MRKWSFKRVSRFFEQAVGTPRTPGAADPPPLLIMGAVVLGVLVGALLAPADSLPGAVATADAAPIAVETVLTPVAPTRRSEPLAE